MLSQILRRQKIVDYAVWVVDPPSEREALGILTVSGWLSAIVYLTALAWPFGLLALAQYSQLSLYAISWAYPLARLGVVAAFALEAVLYWIAWRAARRVQTRDAWLAVLWGAAACALALMLVYPLGSTDIFDYIMHGRLSGIYGANPFVQVGYDYPHDPFFPYMGWPGAPSAYGPLWEIVASAVARVAGDGIVVNVLAFKLLSGLGYAGSVAVLAIILRRVAPDRALSSLLVVAWNPLVLYETFGNGHNDMTMVFLVLAATLFLLKRRYTLAILALLAGTLVKFVPALLLPAAGLLALRGIEGKGARARWIALTTIMGMGLVVLAYAPFWHGLDTLGVARRQQLFTTSLPAVVYTWLAPAWGAERAATVISTIAALSTLCYALFQGLRVWFDRTWTGFVVASFSTLMFYLFVAVLWFMPWYALWPLSLSPLMPSGRAVRLAQLFGFATWLQPVLAAPLLPAGIPPVLPWQQLGMASPALLTPWLYAAGGRLFAR